MSPAQKKEFCSVLHVGCPIETAASYVRTTVAEARAEAERDPAFLADIRQAEAEFELLHMQNILAAGGEPKNWRASTWALEHRFPDRYGRRHAHALSSEQIGDIVTQLADIVAAEVPVPEHRDRVLSRVAELARSLGRPVAQHDRNGTDEDERT